MKCGTIINKIIWGGCLIMQKKAVLFSAGEYLDSKVYPKPNCDLSGVKYDIVAIEKRLKQIGFDVTKKENANKAEYAPALQQCVDGSPSDAIHIVYFSGHGGHYNGKNYIYPSDFTTRYDVSNDIDKSSINIEDIISIFKGKGKLVLILDACRDDFGTSKVYFSEMTSAENVYIAYGTMFQDTSKGVDNGLSWFTEAICDEILTPDIDVDTLFTQVRQNIFSKHYIQIPPSVNALLDEVILHSDVSYDDKDRQVYDFVQRYGDEYTDKYGYFHGDDLIFIDAAQYFNIGLLDAIWMFKKADNKIYKDKGVKVPELSEAETKLVSFLDFTISKKFFSFDESHTWYYNGRQIRMGEIPPLPPSMQQKLPEQGKNLEVKFNTIKKDGIITVTTNLPENCEIFVWNNKTLSSQKLLVSGGKIMIYDASEITKIEINSGVFSADSEAEKIIGDKCRNLTGKFVTYHPIYGNRLRYICEF